MRKRLETLREVLERTTPALLSVSGGLDSRFLAHAAWRWDFEAVLLYFEGPQQTPGERAWVSEWAAAQNRRLIVIVLGPLDLPLAAENDRGRCYHCKRGLYSRALESASELGLPHVLDGSNASDLGEHRPGLRALAELGIKSPLALAGLGKKQIRQAALEWGIPRPSQPSRACLMTRFAYGYAPSADDLELLGLAEDALAALGLAEFRLRRPSAGEYVLQLGRNDADVWESCGRKALQALNILGVEPPRVEFGEEVSGYYD